jgi:heat-inducible transcriptional repressor
MAYEGRDEPLGERAQQLLRTLIESYIRDGQPVGSRTLSRDSGLQLSAATIRNVMADLEELGFVASPHTSAGRVPTDKGYRFFVDTLLQLRPLDEAASAALRRQFEASRDTSSTDLIATVSQLLSSATQLAGVVTMPRGRAAAVSQIEFVALSENRVLVVLVFNDREVQNRIIQLERHYSPDELKRASNYLNDQFRGRSLREVRQEILRQLSETHAHMNQIMMDAIAVARQVFEEGGEGKLEYVIKGETNLMGVAELTSVEKLRRLFEAFNEKRDFLHLLDHSLKAEGVQIFIGHESGYRILDDCSIVTAPYADGDSVVGVLGVIGPTRMAYERVIPIVDVTAKLLSAALNSRR